PTPRADAGGPAKSMARGLLAHRRGLTLTANLAVSAIIALALAQSALAAFPGQNGKIAFESTRDGNYEVYAMNADGTGQANLTNNPATDAPPAVSADGQRIAFASARDGNYEVYAMNADGTGQVNLTNNAAFDYLPAFSPDGQRIAFTSFRDGNTEVYAM